MNLLFQVALVVGPWASAPPVPALPLGVSPQLYSLCVTANADMRPEVVSLGEKLFRDKRLSADDTVSCATCHDPAKGFVDHKKTSEGIRGQRGQRNAPTVLNAMFQGSQFWDGRVATLEEQAKLPVLNPIEMGQKNPEAVVSKLSTGTEYSQTFQKIFGRPLNYDDVAAAIAAYERTQYSGNAPFDRFIQGDDKAMDGASKRGWMVFNGQGRCNECHAFNMVSPIFSDQKFHNIGIAARKQDFKQLAQRGLDLVRLGDVDQIDTLALQSEMSELGRFLVTKRQNDVGAFKSQTLRNIGITGPYMHDGSLATLWDVVDHYNKGGVANPFLDGGIQRLGLSESQIDDLVSFLFALTDDRFAAYNKAQMAEQRKGKNTRPERDTAAGLGKKGSLGDAAPNSTEKNPAQVGPY